MFSSGCSKDLSRRDAAVQIESHWVDLSLGEVEVAGEEKEPGAILQCGLAKGLWRREDLTSGRFMYVPANGLNPFINLVELGDSMTSLDHTKPRIFFAVHPTITGVREGNTASISVVDYTWAVDWDGLPSDVKACLPSSPSLRLGRGGTVVFERYDDGWRFKWAVK